MRIEYLLTAVTVVLAAGCSGKPTEPLPLVDPEIRTEARPALEAVPYAAIGSGRVAFHRTWPDGSTGLVEIDGGTQQSRSYLGGTELIEPSVSPDGTEVAFINSEQGWDIFVVHLDGSELQRITNYAAFEGPPTWTPDGSYVVVQVDSEDGRGVRVRKHSPMGLLAGETMVFLEHFPGTSWDTWHRVSVSTEGSLMFANHSGNTTGVVGVINQGQGFFTHQTFFRFPDPTSAVLPWAPMWSQDGSVFAFLETERDPETGEHIETRIVGSDRKSQRRRIGSIAERAAAPLSGSSDEFSACWTPDGSTIVFTSPDANSDYHVYAVPAAGGSVVQVTTALDVTDSSVSCY